MKTPILVHVYRFISGLYFIAAIYAFYEATKNEEMIGSLPFITYGVILVFAAMVSLGMGQVISLIKNIEINTGIEKILDKQVKVLEELNIEIKKFHKVPPHPGKEMFYVLNKD